MVLCHRPDNCDGTYEEFCDSSREYSNITDIIKEFGKSDLLSYMNEYWKDYSGDDESFWEHEWNKHGTYFASLSI
jgi:ribonuclease T2